MLSTHGRRRTKSNPADNASMTPKAARGSLPVGPEWGFRSTRFYSTISRTDVRVRDRAWSGHFQSRLGEAQDAVFSGASAANLRRGRRCEHLKRDFGKALSACARKRFACQAISRLAAPSSFECVGESSINQWLTGLRRDRGFGTMRSRSTLPGESETSLWNNSSFAAGAR